jgi:hypothetical protein
MKLSLMEKNKEKIKRKIFNLTALLSHRKIYIVLVIILYHGYINLRNFL